VWECIYYSREQKKSKQQNRHANTQVQTGNIPANYAHEGPEITQKFGKGTAVLPAFLGVPVEFCLCCEECMTTNPGSNQKRSYGTTKYM